MNLELSPVYEFELGTLGGLTLAILTLPAFWLMLVLGTELGDKMDRAVSPRWKGVPSMVAVLGGTAAIVATTFLLVLPSSEPGLLRRSEPSYYEPLEDVTGRIAEHYGVEVVSEDHMDYVVKDGDGVIRECELRLFPGERGRNAALLCNGYELPVG